jgi:hypothetical protein
VRVTGVSQKKSTRTALGTVAAVVSVLRFTPLPALAAATGHSVAVSVEEREGVAREAWPLTFGVPWPRGRLRDHENVSVAAGKDNALPVQTRALSRWSDGSIRWLLIDTQVTLAPRQALRLTVSAAGGKRTPVTPPLEVTDDAKQVRIDTGVLGASVPKLHFAVVESVRAGSLSLPAPLTSLIERDGGTARALAPRRVQITERGPLRSRVELEGGYGNGFDYLIRIDAYAGQPFLRLLHTFINRNSAALVRVSRIAIEWPLELPPSTPYVAGAASGAMHTGKLGDGSFGLVQLDNKRHRVNGQERAGTLPGWLALQPEGAGFGLAARWFWQEYPQGFALQPGRLTYNLWDPEGGAAVAGMGAAKTHELVLFAGGKAVSDPRWTAAVGRPLVASVDPTWIAQSGALPQGIAPGSLTDSFLAAITTGFKRYLERNDDERWDDRGEESCDDPGGERPRVGAYGMWNWGDWNFPTYQDDTKGCDAWGNLEYDTTQVLALAFAATSRADMYEAMVVAARHFMDVDVIHYHRKHPEWIGMNHPKNPLHFSFKLGGIDLGHTWAEGLLSYYYLTGDERGLAAARGIADYLAARVGRRMLLANPRQLGWPQIALTAVYQATGEEAYLRAARAYAARAIEVFKAEEAKHWKHGILAEALSYTHALTGDERIERWLRVYARTLREHGMTGDIRFLPALAYVARLSGDASLRALVLERARRMEIGGWGKPFTINGRIGFRTYSLLAGEG